MNLIRRILFIGALLCLSVGVTVAQEKREVLKDDADIMVLSLAENVTIPRVAKKQHESIRSHMYAMAKKLINNGIKVEPLREGEVLVATIPTDELFAPNDSVLLDDKSEKLQSFTGFLVSNGMYKLLLAVHTDDTGSPEYSDRLSESRVYAVYDWFENKGFDMSYVVPYAKGATVALNPNNSRANRAANRRLEVYVVPEKTAVALAKAEKLK